MPDTIEKECKAALVEAARYVAKLTGQNPEEVFHDFLKDEPYGKYALQQDSPIQAGHLLILKQAILQISLEHDKFKVLLMLRKVEEETKPLVEQQEVFYKELKEELKSL